LQYEQASNAKRLSNCYNECRTMLPLILPKGTGMEFEALQRTDYPDRPESTHTDQAHFRDFRDYHLPQARMHHAHIHSAGIARGLEVQGTLGEDSIVVQPGVAIDEQGQLIILTQEESRTTSNFLNSALYVTLKFAEAEGTDGRLVQVPDVRLRTVSEVEGGSAGILVVLALVETDGNGQVVALKEQDSGRQFRRQMLGGQLEALEIQRSARVDDQLTAVPSGKITAGDSGGLRITVPEAGDQMLLAREGGGQFAQLEVRADNVAMPGTLGISGDLNVAGTIQGTLARRSVGSNQLATGAVTRVKIADGAVTLSKMAPGVIRDMGVTVTDLQNGQSIPLPTGFDRSECVFYVALKAFVFDPVFGRQAVICRVDGNGRVTSSEHGVRVTGVAMAKKGGWG
jgi:hypothetical protein